MLVTSVQNDLHTCTCILYRSYVKLFHLQSQLRNKLVTELKHIGPPQPIVSGSVPSAQDGSLLLRASHSLVADHLRYTGLDYSLSVFLPETGTTQDKVIWRNHGHCCSNISISTSNLTFEGVMCLNSSNTHNYILFILTHIKIVELVSWQP